MKKIKYIGSRSMSSTLRAVLNFLWYGQWVVAGLILIKIVLHLFSAHNSFIWPVSFETVIHPNIIAIEDITSATIQTSKGMLSFNALWSWKTNGIMLIGTLLIGAPFLIITYQLRKIFKSFEAEDTFIKPNLYRLRYIGIILIVFPIAKYIFGFVYITYLNTHFDGYNFTNGMDFLPLLFGLFMLILAEVFRIGVEYREDNNLTI